MSRRVIAVALAAAFVISAAVAAPAQAANGRISGVLLDQSNGLPLSGATLVLSADGVTVKTVKSNARGSFTIDGVKPGLYTILIQANGYVTSQSREFVVTQGQETALNLAVNRASVNQGGSLQTIGSVQATTTSAFASTTTITRTLDPNVLQKEDNIRLADALVKLPGVDGEGLSSSPGDDTYINIRGLGASETVALLDGHPVGPIGVYGINGGGSYPTSFNYADTPIFGLSKVQVTFGSGASGLYGVDAIGGTVDMQTINPSVKPQYDLLEGIGNQGRQQTAAVATGTAGKIQYAAAYGVNGTYGMFSPGLVAQTGRPKTAPT